MSSRSLRSTVVMSLLVMLTLVAGCAKKVATAPPVVPNPAPEPVIHPTVTLTASNTFVRSGASVTLNWSSTNATDLNLTPGIGKVPPEGSQAVSPTESTSYNITATGPGGTAQAGVRVTVSPAAPPAPAAQATQTMEELFRANVFDAYFDFNASDIRADSRDGLSKTAQFLRSYPDVRVSIEGHCDERGSTEYNLGLGERRAQTVKNFMVSLGVPAERMETVSWGKERPFCTEHDDNCWQQNRRGHFVMAK
jgi:peptidoglycan-associated lipoprotein